MQDVETMARLRDAAFHDASFSVNGIFSPGDIARAFGADFFDHDACRNWILHQLHHNVPRCPGCRAEVLLKSQPRFWAGDRVKCNCGKFFTALTGTFLSGCQLDFREVILLAILLSLGVSDKTIAEFLNMSPAGIRLWRQKFDALETIRSRGGSNFTPSRSDIPA